MESASSTELQEVKTIACAGIKIDLKKAETVGHKVFPEMKIFPRIEFKPLKTDILDRIAHAKSETSIEVDSNFPRIMAAGMLLHFQERTGINCGFSDLLTETWGEYDADYNEKRGFARWFGDLFEKVVDRYRDVPNEWWHNNQEYKKHFEGESWDDFFHGIKDEYEELTTDGKTDLAREKVMEKLQVYCGSVGKFVQKLYGTLLVHELDHTTNMSNTQRKFATRTIFDVSLIYGAALPALFFRPELLSLVGEVGNLLGPIILVGGSAIAAYDLGKQMIYSDRRSEFTAFRRQFEKGKFMIDAVSVTQDFWKEGMETARKQLKMNKD